MRFSLLTVLSAVVGCAPGSVALGDDPLVVASDLPESSPGEVDTLATYDGEMVGDFTGTPQCDDPTVVVLTNEADFTARVGRDLAACDGDCSGSAIAWETQAAVLAYTSCSDTCGRTLSLDDGEVLEDGTLLLDYSLLNPRPWGCGSDSSRVYTVHAVPLAGYRGIETSMLRSQYSDTGL
jgi:hypothetical protein